MIIDKIIDWQCANEEKSGSAPASYLVDDDDVIELARELCVPEDCLGPYSRVFFSEHSFSRQLNYYIEKNNITAVKSLLSGGVVSGAQLRFHAGPTPEGGLNILHEKSL